MLRVAALTSVGRLREVNEDTFTLLDPASGGQLPEGTAPSMLLSRTAVLGVYDGCGHFPGGASASHIAARIVATRLATLQAGATGDELSRRLLEAVQAGHREVFLANRDSNRGVGTTGTVAAISGTEVRVAHVGDSRGYLFRGGHLGQITEDDTLLRDTIAAGIEIPDELEILGHANIITRALGLPEKMDVAMTSLALRAGDVILLCTDGVWGVVDDPAMAAILGAHPDPAAACRALIQAADDARGPDNETALVALYTPDQR